MLDVHLLFVLVMNSGASLLLCKQESLMSINMISLGLDFRALVNVQLSWVGWYAKRNAKSLFSFTRLQQKIISIYLPFC